MHLAKLSRAFCASLCMMLVQMPGANSAEAEHIVGFPGHPATITLYADSQGSKVLGQQPVADIRLPLTILRDQDEFVQVRIGNATVWVDGALVTIRRAVEGDCKLSTAGSKPVAVAATRGAAQPCR